MNPVVLPPHAAPAASVPEAGLQELARRFPEDLKVAVATAQALRQGPPQSPAPAQEPWPPMQVAS